MSDGLTDVEAKLLLHEVNRRAGLLRIVQNTAPRYWSFRPAELLAGAVIAVLAHVLVREWTFSSFTFLLAACAIVGTARSIAVLNRRVDALVKLLDEDGMLPTSPPNSKLRDKQ